VRLTPWFEKLVVLDEQVKKDSDSDSDSVTGLGLADKPLYRGIDYKGIFANPLTDTVNAVRPLHPIGKRVRL